MVVAAVAVAVTSEVAMTGVAMVAAIEDTIKAAVSFVWLLKCLLWWLLHRQLLWLLCLAVVVVAAVASVVAAA
jgi:hypothetical protein